MAMTNPSTHKDQPKKGRRDKATIDHLVQEVYEDKPEQGGVQSPTTNTGLPVEEQVRKEWDPKKGGLPTF
jgi:hypothetical protein